MKAFFNRDKVLVIVPEDNTERYVLHQWSNPRTYHGGPSHGPLFVTDVILSEDEILAEMKET